MRPRADDPGLDRVRTGTPQGAARGSVVAHLAQSLDQHFRVCLLSLLIFWEVIHRWTLVSEMSGGKLLVSHKRGGGWSRSQGSFQVGGEGRGGEKPPGCRGHGVGGGLGEKGSRQKGGLRGVSRAFAG